MAAQILGVTGSAILAGTITSISYLTIPVISTAPACLMAQQWKTMYDIGSSTAPPFAIVSSACFGFLAFNTSGLPGYLYTAAAVMVPSIVPYTIGFMLRTNEALSELAKASGSTDIMSKVVGDNQTRTLIEKWARLNYGRGLMVTTGAVIGLVATMMSIRDTLEHQASKTE